MLNINNYIKALLQPAGGHQGSLKVQKRNRHKYATHIAKTADRKCRVTGSVQVTRRAVGSKTMHGSGCNLVWNPPIWLVESWNYVN